MKAIGDIQVNMEYLTSKFIQGIVIPNEYVKIWESFCNIPLIDESPLMTLTYGKILKLTVKPNGLLKDKEMESYYYGKNPELLSLLMMLLAEVDMHIMMKHAEIDAEYKSINDFLESTMTQEDGFDGIATAVDATKQQAIYMQELDGIKTDLRRSSGYLEHLITLYGSSLIKCSDKKFKPIDDSIEYHVFLNELLNKLPDVIESSDFAQVATRTLVSILNSFPKESLDPFDKDVCNNLIEVLTNPGKFLDLVTKEEIVHPSIGKIFGFCYPGYYHAFMDIFLEDMDKYSYQKLINFKNSLGVPENYSSTINQCVAALAVTPMQNPQGGI